MDFNLATTTLFPTAGTPAPDKFPMTPNADQLLASAKCQRASDRGGVAEPAPPRLPVDRGHANWPVLDGFEIRDQISTGGMGSVYRALDRELQVEVAVKIPRVMEPETETQFRVEARKLAQVQHPNVVGIRKFDRSNGIAYFTMDLIRGPNAAV